MRHIRRTISSSSYEDVFLNEDLRNIPGVYQAGGEPLVIEKVDDVTFRTTFAAAYPLFIKIAATSNGWYLTRYPKHYMSQFLPKYADADELDKMVADAGFEVYHQLFGSKEDPRRNPDIPVLFAWHLTIPEPNDPIVAERNPYYYKVDPEGNQLPYLDHIEFAHAQDSEQINLRAVQGDVDMQLRHITFDNIPLFQENAEKGDYRVLLWKRGKFDQVIGLNQTNQDPVLREIVQDKRFRQALSLGMNRLEIIEANYLGFGEPSQVSPLPSSPHYWEPQAKDFIEHDPDQANSYLDEMGLTERDAEGYRLRPDGERLSLVYEYVTEFSSWGRAGELLASHWKDLGVELILKANARELDRERFLANLQDISTWTGSGEFDPLIDPRSFIPTIAEGGWGQQYFAWWNSSGAEGIEPTGDVLKLFEIFEEVKVATTEEKQVRLFRQILELNKENLWMLGVSTPPPVPVIVKNNFRNVPEDAMHDDQPRSPGHTATEQYFWKRS